MTPSPLAPYGLGFLAAYLPGFFADSSARFFSAASSRSCPASFSALVPKSIARCWSNLCSSGVPWMKNLFTVCLPCSLPITLQGNAGRQCFGSCLTYLCYQLYIGRQDSALRPVRSRGRGLALRGRDKVDAHETNTSLAQATIGETRPRLKRSMTAGCGINLYYPACPVNSRAGGFNFVDRESGGADV